MNLSKIKLKKPYEDYKTSFKKAIESDTGHKIEDILTAFQAAKYSPAEVAEHIGCTVDVIYTHCKKGACCIKPLTAFKISQIRFFIRQDNLMLLA